MKISIKWLHEWIEVADLDPEELAERLTMAGLEVDGITYPGHGHDGIVVGRIEAIEEHPGADRLVVCRVDAGDGQARVIVCGAKNMAVGDRVPVALPGAQPPGLDFAVGVREVMGVESSGMLCSEEELGLAEESEGLMILDGDLELGTPIFDALGLRDVVIEIDLTPNRADCLSHLGVAREVAALYGRKLRPSRREVDAVARGERPVAEVAALEIQDREGCPHYRLAVLEDVQVGPSPAWLQQRLAAVGQRSINNVVDVTNFILLDVGQPLHAFDLDLLQGHQIVVRRARRGEVLEGIDHKTYELTDADLVIADAERPVAIAGVMGGAETEVTESTRRILLECAYFDPTTVRKSAKRHGLHTESSHRFERGIDPGAVEENVERALQLLVTSQEEVAERAPTLCEGVLSAGRGPEQRRQVTLDVEQASKLIGVSLDKEQCREYLTSIELEELEGQGPSLTFAVPTYRDDLQRPVDLVEELARLYGYDRIPARMPLSRMGEIHRRRKPGQKGGAEQQETIVSQRTRRRLDWVRDILLGQGLLEAVNYSFMSQDDLDRLGITSEDGRRQAPRVANPLVKSQALMRTTLIPSLLDNIQTNLAKGLHDIALFEIGRRYFMSEERRTLGLVVTGARRQHWSGSRDWDFFDLKGVVEALGEPFAVKEARWDRPKKLEPYLHPGVQALWATGATVLATVGQLHPAIAQREEIKAPLFFAEVDIEALLGCGRRPAVSTDPPRYPAVVRDFALLYERDRPYGELRQVVEDLVSDDAEFRERFEAMELFDVYEGEQVPEGLRSLAIKVTYRSRKRTLTEDEVEAVDRKLLQQLQEKVGASLR